MKVRPITQARFEALCYSRQPLGMFLIQEVEWYANKQETLLGIVSFDTSDRDWGWVVLGRDEQGLFRAIDVGVSIKRQNDARALLRKKLLAHAGSSQTIFPQGDTNRRRNELLHPQVDSSRLNPYFKTLIETEHFSPAREIIREIAYAFVDVDGNYAKDFQTSGFNGRL
jgi:hypothetical protein